MTYMPEDDVAVMPEDRPWTMPVPCVLSVVSRLKWEPRLSLALAQA